MTESGAIENRRYIDRRRVLKGARLAFNGGHSTVESVVKNISEIGAYICVKDGILIPNSFELHNELDGFKTDCRIKWRKGNTFGVEFLGDKSPVALPRTQIVSHYTAVNDVTSNSEVRNLAHEEVIPKSKATQITFGKRQ